MRREDLLTGRVQSGGREPAEGDLRLIQDFVNTVDREHGGEVFDSPAGLEEWLALRELPGAPVSEEGLQRALDLREALRTLLLANNGAPGSADAERVLTEAGRAARLTPEFEGATARLEPQAGGLDGTLGRLVAIAFAAMLDGRWVRLKACPRDVCGWVFQDRSTANRGTWCSMRICGNRVKANAYYRRRTRGDQAPG